MATGISLADFIEGIDTTSMLKLQARMLEDTGQYRQALEIYKTVADKCKTDFGETHFESVKIKFRMARILYKLDKNDEALPLFEDVYSRMKVIFGPEDGDGLLARGYLANILRRTDKAALSIYEEIQSRKWPHKPFTLATRINMALELCDQGKFSESLSILDEILGIHHKINSDESAIWSTLGRKMFVLCKQGKYSEASCIARSVHEKKKSALGENHPTTLSSLKDLGVVLADQGEYDQAESALKVVLNEYTKKNDQINILQNQWFLALVLKKHGKLDESLSLFNEQYKILKTNTRETIYLLTIKLIAKIVDQQGKYEEALHLYKEIIEIDNPCSPDSSITYKNIKRIVDQRGKSNITGPSLNELYEIESKKLWEICEDAEKHIEDYP